MNEMQCMPCEQYNKQHDKISPVVLAHMSLQKKKLQYNFWMNNAFKDTCYAWGKYSTSGYFGREHISPGLGGSWWIFCMF